ncbi:hypothetical protein EP7_003537 [Isosphaeraceae bacterium EP7]
MLAAWFACLISAPISGREPDHRDKPPTFAGDVAKILQEKCQICHRPDRVGPFALETYEQARKRAADIAEVVSSRKMPPWMPEPGVGPPLKDDPSLTREQIAILVDWSAAGAPPGDLSTMPPPPQFADDWKLGTPDLVLEPAEEFSIPAGGPDLYRCFVVPSKLARDVFLSAIDFRPANRRVVHHITAYSIPAGSARQIDEADSGPGYSSYSGPGVESSEVLGFWSAGHEASHLPAGIGLFLSGSADLVFQIHYHPSGKPEVDRTRLGLYFSRKPVKQALHWNSAKDLDFRLPPGDPDIEVEASWYVPVDVEALAVSPHMHLLGRSMSMAVTHADGRTQELIRVPEWDPAWQSAYFFQEPLTMRKGSVLKVVAHFDNSPHPRNPNRPPKLVRWGHSVNDEMCDGYVALVKKDQDLTSLRSTDDLPEIFARQRMKNFRKESVKRRR